MASTTPPLSALRALTAIAPLFCFFTQLVSQSSRPTEVDFIMGYFANSIFSTDFAFHGKFFLPPNFADGEGSRFPHHSICVPPFPFFFFSLLKGPFFVFQVHVPSSPNPLLCSTLQTGSRQRLDRLLVRPSPPRVAGFWIATVAPPPPSQFALTSHLGAHFLSCQIGREFSPLMRYRPLPSLPKWGEVRVTPTISGDEEEVFVLS